MWTKKPSALGHTPFLSKYKYWHENFFLYNTSTYYNENNYSNDNNNNINFSPNTYIHLLFHAKNTYILFYIKKQIKIFTV